MTPATMSTVGAVLKGIVTGKSVKTLERPPAVGELAILKVSAVTWGEFRPQESKAMPPDYDPGDCPRAMNGDILISRANTRELVGAPVMVHGDHPHLLLSDKLLKLIPDESAVERRYLVRALRAPAAALHFAQCAGGTSGSMTNITQDNIRTTPIHLPALPEQRRIAAILDQADALRAKRREALAQLDSLTQSIFIEMFGDPATNPMGWPMADTGDVAEVQGGLQVTSARKALPVEVPYLRVANVFRGYLQLDEIKTIRATPAEISRTSLRDNDLLLVEGHGNPNEIGRAALWNGSIAQCVHQNHLIRARFEESKVVPVYACEFLNSPGGRQHLLRAGKTTSGLNTISVSNVREAPVALPPLDLQQTFATRVQAVESHKAIHRAALAESDALFACLQHRAFAGQLS